MEVLVKARVRAIIRLENTTCKRTGRVLHRPLLKQHANTAVRERERLLKLAREFGDETFVMGSSVSDASGGNGAYSLRTMRKGSFFSFAYPGLWCDYDHYDDLNSMLALMVDHGATMPEELVQLNISLLKNRWNVEIRASRREWGACGINWAALYNSFIAYGFESGNDRLYWNVYWDHGGIAASSFSPANAPLFVNEPPPYASFVNRFTNKPQPSRANVTFHKWADGTIWLKALERILPGDELIGHYGPMYHRTYDINMGDAPSVYVELNRNAGNPDFDEDAVRCEQYNFAKENYQDKGVLFKSDCIYSEQFDTAVYNELVLELERRAKNRPQKKLKSVK